MQNYYICERIYYRYEEDNNLFNGIELWITVTGFFLEEKRSAAGEGITGYNYVYLNDSPIFKLVETEYTDRNGDIRKRRERVL